MASSSASSAAAAPAPPRSLAPAMAFSGALAVCVLNMARHRPLLYQPWLHAAALAVGGLAGARLAAIYDDTADVLNRQSASYASLPSWAHGQLSPEHLGADPTRRARRRQCGGSLARTACAPGG